MGYGRKGHLGISAQQSFGTDTASFDYVPIVSESLTTNIEQMLEENMRSRFEESPTREGLLTVAGDIVMEAHPIMIGHFLRGVIGSHSVSAQSSAWDHQFLPGQTDFDAVNCALPPFTLSVFRDVGSSFQFRDAVIHGLTLEITGGGFIRATANVMARVSSLMNPLTPAFLDEEPWRWDTGSISIAGAGNATIENLSISIINPLEGVTFITPERIHDRYKRSGDRTYGANGTVDFSDITEYTKFRSQSEQRFQINFKGVRELDGAGVFENLLIDLPKVRYTTYEAGMGGPNRLQANFSGNGKYDTTSSYGCEVTLTNSRTAYAN